MEPPAMEPLERLTDCLDEWGPDWEDRIRQAPLKSVVGAVLLGYLVSFLPLRAGLRVIGKMIGVLLWPALLVFGWVKLSQSVQGKKGGGFSSTDLEFPRSLDSH